MNARLFSFVGGEIGQWRVVNISAVAGDALADVKRLNIVAGAVPVDPERKGVIELELESLVAVNEKSGFTGYKRFPMLFTYAAKDATKEWSQIASGTRVQFRAKIEGVQYMPSTIGMAIVITLLEAEPIK